MRFRSSVKEKPSNAFNAKYQPRLIRAVSVSSETVTTRIPDTRSSYRKLVDSLMDKAAPESERREFKGLKIISDCVIDFGPYPQKLGVSLKTVTFHNAASDAVITTYYSVKPISLDEDGNYVCTIGQFSHRTRKI